MRWTATVPYRAPASAGIARPYLTLYVTGTNGYSDDVTGIVDSGADMTSFPVEFASDMGYSAHTLDPVRLDLVAGTVVCFRGSEPVTVVVPEIPSVVVESYPLFVPRVDKVLWGRRDFMRGFDVLFQERMQQFTLSA